MLSETSFRAIIVMPAYRLNVYGFLASQELLYESTNRSGTVGNMGFWDQRLALQWTYTNISYFQGNPSNITVAGYSAGSHSVFYQLAYDLDYPPEKRIIKRVCMHANGPGVQPKSLQEHQEHFDELLVVLKISTAFPASEKLKRLRETKPATFRKATNKMRLHQFRAVTDGHFVKDDLFQRLEDGTFAKKLLESNVEILIGESVNEHHMYANHYTPKNNPEAVYKRLLADYPKWAVDKLREVYFQDGSLPAGVKSWRELFGRIYADIQVHASERGFVDALIRGGAGDLIHRYHIAWRSDVTWSAKKFGATHWSDNVIWFFGDGKSLPETEKVMVRSAFLDQYSKFVRGEAINWQTNGPLQIRRLVDNGKIEIWQDEWWEEKLRVWKALQTAMPKAKLGLRSSL
jgi:carboxylesterase type B